MNKWTFKVDCVVSVRKDHFNFELLPTLGLAVKPRTYNTETGEPIGKIIGIVACWTVVAIVVKFIKQ